MGRGCPPETPARGARPRTGETTTRFTRPPPAVGKQSHVSRAHPWLWGNNRTYTHQSFPTHVPNPTERTRSSPFCPAHGRAHAHGPTHVPTDSHWAHWTPDPGDQQANYAAATPSSSPPTPDRGKNHTIHAATPGCGETITRFARPPAAVGKQPDVYTPKVPHSGAEPGRTNQSLPTQPETRAPAAPPPPGGLHPHPRRPTPPRAAATPPPSGGHPRRPTPPRRAPRTWWTGPCRTRSQNPSQTPAAPPAPARSRARQSSPRCRCSTESAGSAP